MEKFPFVALDWQVPGTEKFARGETSVAFIIVLLREGFWEGKPVMRDVHWSEVDWAMTRTETTRLVRRRRNILRRGKTGLGANYI